MSSGETNEYLLGTHDAELERLGFQHRVWTEQAFAIWERAGFSVGHTLLDVGAGPGFATVELAQLVGPEGRVVAVDASERYVAHLNRHAATLGLRNIETRVCDVQRLDLPAAFDGAYARWVLCWVRDAEAVVAGVARALRPGGVFAVQDYFNYRSLALAPRTPIFDRVVAAIHQSYVDGGVDDDVAGRLPGIMERCGLRVREIRPILRVARPGTALWNWPTTFFRNYVPKIVASGHLSEGDSRAFFEEWDRRSRDDGSFFSTPPVYDIIAVK